VQNRSPMHIKRPKMLMFQVGEFWLNFMWMEVDMIS
jgi:hypothetical protein